MAQATSDKDKLDLHGETDAEVWADAFMGVAATTDEPETDDDLRDFMVTWFANAIMSGYDKGFARAEEIEGANHIAALGYVSAELAARSDAWNGNAPEWFPEPPEWLELFQKGLEEARSDTKFQESI